AAGDDLQVLARVRVERQRRPGSVPLRRELRDRTISRSGQEDEMSRVGLLLGMMLAAASVCYAGSDGAWLKKVSAADRARTNPYAGDAEAIAAGRNLFRTNCAKCHGEDAKGKGSRPSLTSERLREAADGEIFWILKNGEPFKGMPSWGALPEPERW